MKKLSSKQAERIYESFQMLANASQDYYDREEFIYFSCFNAGKNFASFKLKCTDDSMRTVKFIGETIRLDGKGSDRVNPLIERILLEG